MPELPEVEAWRQLLDRDVEPQPDRAGRTGPHRDAEDVRPAALRARRRAASPARGGAPSGSCFPTDDGELVLMVHLMSAGRLRYLAPGREEPEDAGVPAPVRRRRRARADRGREEEARRRLAAAARGARRPSSPTSGPEADELDADSLATILASDSRRLHSLLRDQRLIAGIGRAWANEILHAATLSPYELSTADDGRGDRAARRRRSATSSPAGSSCGCRAPRTRRPTASTTGSASPAGAAGPRSPASTSRSTRSTTAPTCQTDGRVLKDRRMSRLLR